jgi:Fic family protein
MFSWAPRVICDLNYQAMKHVMPNAGELRKRSDVEILGSRHVPPPHEDVQRLVEEACAFVNERPLDGPLFLAAYILWRLCWIHPFDDGNGRTARAVSYALLSQRMRLELPGAHPIPERIKHAPRAYWHALEAADRAWSAGTLDVSELEQLLAFYLEAQLRNDPLGLPP